MTTNASRSPPPHVHAGRSTKIGSSGAAGEHTLVAKNGVVEAPRVTGNEVLLVLMGSPTQDVRKMTPLRAAGTPKPVG